MFNNYLFNKKELFFKCVYILNKKVLILSHLHYGDKMNLIELKNRVIQHYFIM